MASDDEYTRGRVDGEVAALRVCATDCERGNETLQELAARWRNIAKELQRESSPRDESAPALSPAVDVAALRDMPRLLRSYARVLSECVLLDFADRIEAAISNAAPRDRWAEHARGLAAPFTETCYVPGARALCEICDGPSEGVFIEVVDNARRITLTCSGCWHQLDAARRRAPDPGRGQSGSGDSATGSTAPAPAAEPVCRNCGHPVRLHNSWRGCMVTLSPTTGRRQALDDCDCDEPEADSDG